ncbi:fibronectin type III domain-containing protein, partial [Candidatus Woesearchaeota archaeon]|nr:fibronectin type III domain-containing protein [Candidatus Woesearchaeota archaeon]
MKNSIKQLISVFLIELVILLPIAFVDALSITDIRVEELKEKSAKVSWSTDESSGSYIEFGKERTLGQKLTNPDYFGKEHSFLLEALSEDTRYYYKVTAAKGEESVTEDNEGNLYDFTTPPKTPLFLNASIPLHYNQGHKFDVTGKSLGLAYISLFLEDEFKGEVYSSNEGNFNFPGIDVEEGRNRIRLTAKKEGVSIDRIYSMDVDTIVPVITLKGIPDIISSEKVTLEGSTSETVNISFYVKSSAEDSTPPPKILNLINTSTDDIVKLGWEKTEVDDFAGYIIYRDDKAIAFIPDISYDEYSDLLVNSGQSYVYEAAAMDTSGNIGPRSDPLEVKTPEGSITGKPEPPEKDVSKEVSGLQKTIKTDAEFSEELELGEDDGFYNIRVEASDAAGNIWSFQKDVLLDQKDPEIEIISPKSGAEIYENYADMVTIRGRSEPGSRIYLYVSRTPLGEWEDSWDISGFAESLSEISEGDLRVDANCKLNIGGEEKCRSHADYETVTGADGTFEFEDVDLTSILSGALRLEEYETGDFDYTLEEQGMLRESLQTNILAVAIDAAGRKGAEDITYKIATCWSKGMKWDSTPLVEYQSPTFLNVERLKEGTESIYFYLNFTYQGTGKNSAKTRITNINIKKACGSGYLEKQPRYDYSCRILGSCSEHLNPSGRTAYVACRLGRLEGIETWHDHEWESFIEAVKNEMTFPFKLTLTYSEEMEDSTVNTGQTHHLCTEVGYVVDAAYVNPRKILPDWLLYDFVDFLDSSIERIDEWHEKVREILEWAAIGCMVSFFVKFIMQIYRKIVCHYDRIFKAVEDVTSSISGTQQGEDKCADCLIRREGGADGEVMKLYKDNKDVQDHISDTCLKICYQSCSSAWESEAKLYSTYRWACDRVFGREAPSRWTENVPDAELYEKAASGSGCSNDQSVRGKPLRAVRCKDIEKSWGLTFSRDDICFEIISQKDREKRLYKLGKKVKDNLYEIDFKKGDSIKGYRYVIKQNEDYYFTHQDLSCEEVCRQAGKVPITKMTKSGNTYTLDTPAQQGQESASVMCTTTNQCLSLEDTKLKIAGSDDVTKVESAKPAGYTTDCYYLAQKDPAMIYTESLNSPDVVSGDPDKRAECCCINSEPTVDFGYYIPEDIETKDNKERGAGDGSNKDGLSNMKWSYRYSKIDYKAASGATAYNNLRYIEGRDSMACFGQNHLFYDGLAQEGKKNLLTIDPMTQHVAAFQCLALSQILNRLAMLKNMMGAMQNCLLSIRTTGRGDTGICKELFSQYICAFIWKMITWLRDGCLPLGKGINTAYSDNRYLEALSVGMGSIWDTVAESQDELSSEYGNAQLNNLLGMGEEDVFRKVCLGAFGYDWEIDAESLLDAAYQSPYATLVQAILPGREYLTFDPVNYNAKYEYRTSWMVNPGCKLEGYEVYLACVTRNDMFSHGDIDCSKQSDPYGINCDCLALPPDKAPPLERYYSSPRGIEQNELQNIDSTQISGRIKSKPYRYDHLMFKLNLDRSYAQNQADTSKCFPEGHEDGIFYFPITDYTAREIAGCTIDAASGSFSCRSGASFFYDQGNAWITQIDIGDKQIINLLQPSGITLRAGDRPAISATIRYEKDEREQCLIARLMDDEGFVKESINPIRLREGQTSGEVSTRNIYTITEADISSEGYGFSVKYEDENGNRKDAVMLYYTSEKATKQGYGGNLIFTDDRANGEGITISATSTDSYEYRGTKKQIKDCYQRGRRGECVIELDDMGARMIVTGVDPIPGAGLNPRERYNFFVEYTGRPEDGATLEPKFYLHIDLRYPLTERGKCDDVSGIEYDGSDRIIVSNGIPQSVDIPIYILPGSSRENTCAPSPRNPIASEDACVCGSSNSINCPKGDLKFCYYDKCRKYPQCAFNQKLEGPLLGHPCVCSPDTKEGKYDCGNVDVNSKDDANFPESSREGWFCYE